MKSDREEKPKVSVQFGVEFRGSYEWGHSYNIFYKMAHKEACTQSTNSDVQQNINQETLSTKK